MKYTMDKELVYKISKRNYDDKVEDPFRMNVFDPCMGWGGRMLGVLSSDKPYNYIGTDVNENNEGCYEKLGDFIREHISTEEPLSDYPTKEYHIFNERAEMIQFNKEFQKYKGKIDLVITSPPYFDREVYSVSNRQSSIRYKDFMTWKRLFLEPTLQTCYSWMGSGTYMLWNISDIKRGENDFIPLEQESIEYATMMGFHYIGKIGMVMSRMVGLDVSSVQNSWFDEKTKKDYKVEPIFVFYKKGDSGEVIDPVHYTEIVGSTML
jgi:hypothetical protein